MLSNIIIAACSLSHLSLGAEKAAPARAAEAQKSRGLGQAFARIHTSHLLTVSWHYEALFSRCLSSELSQEESGL